MSRCYWATRNRRLNRIRKKKKVSLGFNGGEKGGEILLDKTKDG